MRNNLLAKFVLCLALFFPFQVQAGPEHALLEAAKFFYEDANSLDGDAKRKGYENARKVLDEIVEKHPSSDLAVRILLKEEIEGLDTREIDQFLAIPSVSDSEQNESETAKPLSNSMQMNDASTNEELSILTADEPSESALNLEKLDIRDLQARLLVSGYNPNGVDGVIGNGTRKALKGWQSATGIEPTGYLNRPQLTLLKKQSQPDLDAWLQDPSNQNLYNPPPPIAIGPNNIAGSWRYTSNCSRKSKVGKMRTTGAITLAYAGGNNYSGNISSSLGFRGRISIRLSGRKIRGQINWGLLVGRETITGRVADQELVISGWDSSKCSFRSVKN